MIINHEISEQCSCRNCGSLRFRHEHIYELRDANNSMFDKSYELYNRQDAIVCADCGTVYDQSTLGKVLGIFKQNNVR